MGRAFQHGLGPCGVGPCLIPYRREARDAFAEGGFGRVERTGLDGVVEPLEAHIRLGRALVQFSDVLAASLDAFLPAIQQRGEHICDSLGVQQPFLDVADHDAVQLVHRDRAALAASVALPRPDRTGIITVAAVLAGAQRHGPAAIAAIADVRQQVWAADDARRRHLRIVDLQAPLNPLERLKVDQRRHRDGGDFLGWFQLLGLGPLVELMLADIDAARIR